MRIYIFAYYNIVFATRGYEQFCSLRCIYSSEARTLAMCAVTGSYGVCAAIACSSDVCLCYVSGSVVATMEIQYHITVPSFINCLRGFMLPNWSTVVKCRQWRKVLIWTSLHIKKTYNELRLFVSITNYIRTVLLDFLITCRVSRMVVEYEVKSEFDEFFSIVKADYVINIE